MKDKIYLIIGPEKVRKLTKNYPSSISRDEIILELSLTVPDRLFQKPTLKSKVEVSDDMVTTVEIDPIEMVTGFREKLNDLKEVLKDDIE